MKTREERRCREPFRVNMSKTKPSVVSLEVEWRKRSREVKKCCLHKLQHRRKVKKVRRQIWGQNRYHRSSPREQDLPTPVPCVAWTEGMSWGHQQRGEAASANTLIIWWSQTRGRQQVQPRWEEHFAVQQQLKPLAKRGHLNSQLLIYMRLK